MKCRLWGVRGSIPCSGLQYQRYGGNTSCVGVTLDDGHLIILDAGSGIRELGDALMHSASSKSCTIFISHGHWDHILGLPFFTPLYDRSWQIEICALNNVADVGLSALMHKLFDAAFFPVPWREGESNIRLTTLQDGVPYEVHGARLTCRQSNHPQLTGSLRIEQNGQSLFYSADHELGYGEQDLSNGFFTNMREADVAIVDAQYTLDQYADKVGWGHSALEQWPSIATQLKVHRLLLTHHDPSCNDATLDMVAERLLKLYPPLSLHLRLAYEGMELECCRTEVFSGACSAPEAISCPNCDILKQLSQFTDVSDIYNTLLTKARVLCNADAGTLYLVEDGRLVFAYAQNETLFTESQWARQQYLNASLEINESSIAGYCALHRLPMRIPNVYDLPQDAPYNFNNSFDKAMGYKTESMCVLPICTKKNELVGIIQLINSKEDGKIQPFTGHMMNRALELCNVGVESIKQAQMVQNIILRMQETAALRDPMETAGHVKRVGAMVAEIFHHWAEKRGMDIVEIRAKKGSLRLASMLHDIGKVGIPDAILKKPGTLDNYERAVMITHSALGGNLFKNARSHLEALAGEIALHHHDKWDGTGYTGDPNVPPSAGEAIPVGARLTAIADVFDALVSLRCYKEPWPVDKAIELLKAEAGKHFDPEMVEAFLEIQDTIIAIRERFKEPDAPHGGA